MYQDICKQYNKAASSEPAVVNFFVTGSAQSKNKSKNKLEENAGPGTLRIGKICGSPEAKMIFGFSKDIIAGPAIKINICFAFFFGNVRPVLMALTSHLLVG